MKAFYDAVYGQLCIGLPTWDEFGERVIELHIMTEEEMTRLRAEIDVALADSRQPSAAGDEKTSSGNVS